MVHPQTYLDMLPREIRRIIFIKLLDSLAKCEYVHRILLSSIEIFPEFSEIISNNLKVERYKCRDSYNNHIIFTWNDQKYIIYRECTKNYCNCNTYRHIKLDFTIQLKKYVEAGYDSSVNTFLYINKNLFEHLKQAGIIRIMFTHSNKETIKKLLMCKYIYTADVIAYIHNTSNKINRICNLLNIVNDFISDADNKNTDFVTKFIMNCNLISDYYGDENFIITFIKNYISKTDCTDVIINIAYETNTAYFESIPDMIISNIMPKIISKHNLKVFIYLDRYVIDELNISKEVYAERIMSVAVIAAKLSDKSDIYTKIAIPSYISNKYGIPIPT